MRRLPPLSALRAFEAAARHGSFKRAADELGVTPTAISHQIRALEAHVGSKLFAREARRVVLTADAQALFEVLREGFDAFAGAVARLGASPVRAVVTISATTAFTAKWLVPRVSRFQLVNPGIDLRLHASDDPVEVGVGGVDFAIRYGRGAYPDLVSSPMVADRFAPVVNLRMDVVSPDDLRRVPLIHFDWKRPDAANPTWAGWCRAAGMAEFEPVSVLRFSDESHAIQAAIAGQGAALLSLTLVSDELANGLVRQPFGPILAGLTYHLVEAPTTSRAEHVEAAKAWLLGELGS